ncbi:MAG: hypothetical protein ACP5KW_07775 [Thermoproteota archaeon]
MKSIFGYSFEWKNKIRHLIPEIEGKLDRLHLNWLPAPKHWCILKDEMKNLYPHARELIKRLMQVLRR